MFFSRGPAVFANEGYEDAFYIFFTGEVVAFARELGEGLYFSGAGGADETSAFDQLLAECVGDFGSRGGDDDRVIGGFVGGTETAVAAADGGVGIAECFKARGCAFG